MSPCCYGFISAVSFRSTSFKALVGQTSTQAPQNEPGHVWIGDRTQLHELGIEDMGDILLAAGDNPGNQVAVPPQIFGQ